MPSSRLRARDVRERLKGKCEPDVMYCLEALAEQQGVLHQMLMDCAATIDSMANILAQHHVVAKHLKDQTDRLKGIQGNDDDGQGPITS